MGEDNYSVFADISVLIDYCTPYTPNHQYATVVLNELRENGGEVIICKDAGKALTNRITNQQKLFTFLFDEASRCISEYSYPKKVFKGEVLNRERLGRLLPVGISTTYNIQSLRQYLEENSIEDFREKVYDFRRINHRQQRRLENSIISERYEVGGADMMYVKLAIESKVNDEAQVNSAITGLYWCDRNGGKKMLVRHSHPLYKERDDLQSALPSHYDIDFLSPKEAIKG